MTVDLKNISGYEFITDGGKHDKSVFLQNVSGYEVMSPLVAASSAVFFQESATYEVFGQTNASVGNTYMVAYEVTVNAPVTVTPTLTYTTMYSLYGKAHDPALFNTTAYEIYT